MVASTFYTGGPGAKRTVKHGGFTATLIRDGEWTEGYIRDALGKHVSGIAGRTPSMAAAVKLARAEMSRLSTGGLVLPTGTRRA
jgi:hypothetical protein